MPAHTAHTLALALLTLLPATLSADKKQPTAPRIYEPDEYPQPLPHASHRPATLVTLNQPPQRATRYQLSTRQGIDVSHYQGNINWQTASRDPRTSYVYIKATESSSLADNMYRQNLRGARRAGIPAGTYHFFSPTTSAVAQLLNLTHAMPDLREQDLLPMVDVETRGKRDPASFRQSLRQFLKGIEDTYGVRPIIYTGANFYNKYLSGHFDEYLFMIAKYADAPPALNGNPKFAIWQYSSKGQVPGIRGYVDLSRFIDSYDLADITIPRR